MGDIKVAFGKRVKQLRQLRELTQQEFAEKANISISFLGNIERGNKSPTVETLQKMADALDVTLSELMTFDSGVIIVEDDKAIQLRRLLSEYADRIDKLYKE